MSNEMMTQADHERFSDLHGDRGEEAYGAHEFDTFDASGIREAAFERIHFRPLFERLLVRVEPLPQISELIIFTQKALDYSGTIIRAGTVVRLGKGEERPDGTIRPIGLGLVQDAPERPLRLGDRVLFNKGTPNVVKAQCWALFKGEEVAILHEGDILALLEPGVEIG